MKSFPKKIFSIYLLKTPLQEGFLKDKIIALITF